MYNPQPTVEWCLEHERHERIPACEPVDDEEVDTFYEEDQR